MTIYKCAVCHKLFKKEADWRSEIYKEFFKHMFEEHENFWHMNIDPVLNTFIEEV